VQKPADGEKVQLRAPPYFFLATDSDPPIP
jgi:hypothetical protein